MRDSCATSVTISGVESVIIQIVIVLVLTLAQEPALIVSLHSQQLQLVRMLGLLYKIGKSLYLKSPAENWS